MKTILTNDYLFNEKINKLSFYDASGQVSMILKVKGEIDDKRKDRPVKEYIILFLQLVNNKLLKRNLKEMLFLFDKHYNKDWKFEMVNNELVSQEVSTAISELRGVGLIDITYDDINKDYVYELTEYGHNVAINILQDLRNQCELNKLRILTNKFKDEEICCCNCKHCL